MNRGSSISIFCGTCLLGCTDAPEPPSDLPPLAWQAEHVAFGTDVVDDVCVGTLETLDRYVESVEHDLELGPGDASIPVRVVSDIGEQCGAEQTACVRPGGVFIGGIAFSHAHHELVHARLAQIRPSAKPFFEEGLATAVGGDTGGCRAIDACASVSLDEFLLAAKSSDLDWGYLAGADMIHGMLLAEGPSAVLALTSEVPRGAAPDAVRMSYAEHFDASLDVDFDAYKRGAFDDYTPAQVGCEAPPAPVTDLGGVVLQASMQCDLPNVVNDFSRAATLGERDGGVVQWTFVVAPEHAGAYELTGADIQDTELGVRACVVGSLAGRLNELGPWNVALSLIPADLQGRQLFLGPGLHQITWRHTFDVGATLDVTLAPPCTFELQDCAEGEQCTIWNLCEAEVEQPAALGEACDQAPGDPLACAAGSRCLGGVCVLECDATQACPAGQACARIRVCGPGCDLLAQDCEPGFSCLPSEDPDALQVGQGQCIPEGQAKLFDACDTRDGVCREGLSCEDVSPTTELCDPGELDGCCLPLCDPMLMDAACASEIPICEPMIDGVAGICRE